MAQRNPVALMVGVGDYIGAAIAKRFAVALFLSLGLHAAIGFGLAFLPMTPKIQPSPILQAVLIPPTAQPRPKESAAPANATEDSKGAAIPASDAAAAPSQPSLNKVAPSLPQGTNAPSKGADAKAPSLREGPFNYLTLRDEIAAFGLAAVAREQAEPAAPRTRRLSPAAQSVAEAAYLEMWRQKVERIGKANYPAKAAYGDLKLRLLIRHDGALLNARVVETSGIAELDQAALDILHLAAPFAQFSVDMRKSYDQLEITRRWRFSRSGAQLVK